MQAEFNILRNSDIYNCTDCVHDSRIGYFVDWPANNDLGIYDYYSNLTSVTTWGGVYFGVSTSSSCYFGPSTNISIDGSIYSVIKIKMRIDMGHHTSVPGVGKVEFQTSADESWTSSKSVPFNVTADNSYVEYVIDASSVRTWMGNITRLRVYPFVDGVEGLKIHVKYIKVESRNRYACDSGITGGVCDKFSFYSHPCPWVGAPGKAVSAGVSGPISIAQGVNDKLLVNIDGYGEQAVTLEPGDSLTLFSVARDIQDKLNLVGVGGYAFARCYIEDSKFVVEADWNDSSSSVIISQPDTASAAVSLGFFDSSGNALYTSMNGEDAASRYERAPRQLTSSELRRLRNSEASTNNSSFVIEGGVYSPQGGNSDYEVFSRDEKIPFKNKTLIDYDNPVNYNGVITKVAYSGDSLTNTEFRIYRQKIDGTLTLVGSVDMSSDPKVEGRVFESSCSIRVKKGDLLSLYSASLHAGSVYEKENYTYLFYDGDFSGGLMDGAIYGSGNRGLPIFARGDRLADEASIDVDFDNTVLLESVEVLAEEEDIAEYINLCTVRNEGLGGGPHIEGTTEAGDDGAPSLDVKNLSALVDGDKNDVNSESTYCYPGWLDLSASEAADYDYSGFSVSFDFAKGIDVYFPVYKIVSYFVDSTNIKTFKWEVPVAFSPDDLTRTWGVGWSEYAQVFTELGIMDSDNIYLYSNPAVLLSGDFQVSYSHLEYKYLELVLQEPYDTRSIKYNATLEGTNITDESKDDYAYFAFHPSPKIQQVEVYTKSVPERRITSSFYFESADDSGEFMAHSDSSRVTSNKSRYTIGRPTNSIRIHVSSDNSLKVYDIRGTVSESPVRYTTNHPDMVALNPSVAAPSGSVGRVYVENDSSSTSSFYIDIEEEPHKTERCLLWSKLSTDDDVSQSELGPGGIASRRNYRSLRPYNYAYNCPGYFFTKDFFSGQPAYVSRDGASSWFNIGSIISDGSESSYITSENSFYYKYPFVYVALDLGYTYDISAVNIYSGDDLSFSEDLVLYSFLDVSDPSSIPFSGYGAWSASYKDNARWLLFKAPSVSVGSVDARYIRFVEIDATLGSTLNRGRSIWKSAEGFLTNGVSGRTGTGNEEGWVSDGQSDYFCVDLGWWHNVSNVMAGPFYDSASGMDVDSIEPGTWPSIVDSTGAGTDVAYSKDGTDNPDDVIWSAFGSAPENPVRWVLVKVDNSRVEEIIVHTDNNLPEEKDSFLSHLWASSGSNSVYSDYVNTRAGLCALAMDYPEGFEQEDYILFKQSLGIDDYAAKRDSLSFWLYVSDPTQLDYSHGYIRLGRAEDEDNTPFDINLTTDDVNYYQWDLSSLEGVLNEGWSYLSLPFSDSYKVGDIYFASDDLSRLGSTNSRDRIKYFKIAFKGVGGNKAFTVRVDDLRITRRRYSQGTFDYGVYLPDREYVRYPLNDFDPMNGTVEFFIKSDWTKEIVCNSCEDPRDHSLFRIYSADTDILFSLFMTGDGLKFYASDGENPAIITDNTLSTIDANNPTHVAVTWNFSDIYDTPSMAMYINNNITVSLDYNALDSYGSFRPSFIKSALYTLMLGGLEWQGLVSSDASSADAAIENIKVFNYPVSDFSYSLHNQNLPGSKEAHELVEISLDGVNFYGVEDRASNLPLVKKSVLSGESFYIYIRSRDLDKTAEGEKNRRANISIKRTA